MSPWAAMAGTRFTLTGATGWCAACPVVRTDPAPCRRGRCARRGASSKPSRKRPSRRGATMRIRTTQIRRASSPTRESSPGRMSSTRRSLAHIGMTRASSSCRSTRLRTMNGSFTAARHPRPSELAGRISTRSTSGAISSSRRSEDHEGRRRRHRPGPPHLHAGGRRLAVLRASVRPPRRNSQPLGTRNRPHALTRRAFRAIRRAYGPNTFGWPSRGFASR